MSMWMILRVVAWLTAKKVLEVPFALTVTHQHENTVCYFCPCIEKKIEPSTSAHQMAPDRFPGEDLKP
jgi:hypothetical protein